MKKKLKTFYVGVREVWVQQKRVEATSAKEAIEKVARDEDCEDVSDAFEYSHTLDKDTFTTDEHP